MTSARYERHLSQSPEVVWAFLADPNNDRLWRQEIEHVDVLAGSPGSADLRYRERVEWEGVSATVSLSITSAEPGSRLVVETEEPGYRSRSQWDFRPEEAGTHLTLQFTLDAQGALKLAEPFMWAILNRWLERDLDTLESNIPAASE